jgi:SAM-dependent methyltransferase
VKQAIRIFAEEAIAALPMKEPILEIGARPAEGQEELADIRSLLPGTEYIGCDIQEGPNVDQVEDVHALSFADGSIGTVLAFETLEHVADPIRAVQEMHRVLAPGGVAVITSCMFFPIHEHPWDYWRFTPEGFGKVLEPFEQRLVMAQGWELMPENVLGVGAKGPIHLRPEMFPRTAKIAATWPPNGEMVDFGPIRLTVRQLWKRTLQESVAAAKRRAARHQPSARSSSSST